MNRIGIYLTFLIAILISANAWSGAIVEFRDEVVVENDGNGVTSGTFTTTQAGNGVTQILFIENGCRTKKGRCKTQFVESLSVTLNDDLIFENITGPDDLLQIALAPQGQENRIVISAQGQPESTARITIVSHQLTTRLSGRSILAAADDLTFTVVHNAGPTPLAYRIVFFLPDGTEAGRTEPKRLQPHAADQIDFAAASTPFNWTAGPVQVIWASLGQTRVSAIAFQTIDILGQTVPVRDIELDDFGTTPINKTLFDDITGGLLDQTLNVPVHSALQE